MSDKSSEPHLPTGFSPASNKEGPYFFSYIGRSMNPTLVEPALMEIWPYLGCPIQKGDVVCIDTQGDSHFVVHRVMQVTKAGITTRGDHNLVNDTWLLQEHQIVGKVTAFWQGKKRRNLRSGILGYWLGRALHRLSAFEGLFVKALGPLYHWLVSKKIISTLASTVLHPQIISVKVGDQERRLMFLGNMLIGRYDPALGTWQIKRPFRLVIDVQRLENRR